MKIKLAHVRCSWMSSEKITYKEINMGFRNDAYATVWDSKPGKGKYNELKIQISKKNKDTDKYETDFSGWVRFVGKAAELGLLPERTRIKIKSCDVTNFYNKDSKVMYWTPVVFEAELCDSRPQINAIVETDDNDFLYIPEGIDEEIPFT